MKRAFMTIMTMALLFGALARFMSVFADQPVALPREALETIRRMAIQHNGRNKPFDSFARETLRLITGSARVGNEDPVETILTLMASPDHGQQLLLVSVPFIPLRKALGMDPKATQVSYNDLVATRKLMRLLPPIVQKQQREEKLSMLEEETMDVFQRFATLSTLLEQKLNLVPPPVGSAERVWQLVEEPSGYAPAQQETIRTAWSGLIGAVQAGRGDAVITSARHAADALRDLSPSRYPPRWRLAFEVFYNHVAPFRIAQGFYLLSAILLFLSLGALKKFRPALLGFVACCFAFLAHGSGILMRVVLGERPPVSNFFETTLWLPFVAVAIALILERVYRTRYIALAAAILATITLVLADHLPLDSSISPVVAVLHSNLWLTIHVLTIVASYGALTLAIVLAHMYGGMYLSRRTSGSTLDALGTFLYRVIQVGVVLLAAGIMLGAVWANASWGRYWGWDPKETWALITLIWFLALLHGRFAGWISGVGVALCTVGGFFLLLMTYYGVSFYLVGLHSYAGAHAKPLPPVLIAYLIAELAFIIVVSVSAILRRRPA